MSIQLVQYSDSDEDTEQDSLPTVTPNDTKKNDHDKKRKRSQLNDDTDESGTDSANQDNCHQNDVVEHSNDDTVTEPAPKRQKTEQETKHTQKKKKKPKIKWSSININEKLSNETTDKIEFLQSAKQQHTQFALENVMENELNKIEETNEEKRHRMQYQKRLKKLEMSKVRQQEGLKRKKEHKKYLKNALKEHLDEFGEKLKVKGVGKGGHTKNQRVAW